MDSKQASKRQARGVTCVHSATRPECHAPSGYSVKDYSGKPAANGIAPRDRMRDTILAFWEAQGVARYQTGGAGGGGRWMVRDILHDASVWMPLAGQGEESRATHAELSHVRACERGGAWCAGNLLPENGADNAARGSRDIPASDLTAGARALLAAWPAYWRENYARPASLARLA
jgi:hypothetical protein